MSPPTLTRTAGALLDVGAPAVALLTAPADSDSDPAGASVLAGSRPAADELLAALGIGAGVEHVERILAAEKAKGEAGEVVAVPLDRSEEPFRLLLAGTGAGDAAGFRAAGAALARKAAARERLAVAADLGPPQLGNLAEGLGLGAYGFTERTGDPPKTLREAYLVGAPDPAGDAALARAAAVVEAVYLARDLINTPSLEKSPGWLADQAVAAAGRAGLGVRVLEPDELAAGGFGGLVAVGQGSPRGPRLVVLSYEPDAAPAGDDHVVLVGKGITFDSGGLSLKPPASMITMKTDMAGSAAVLGAMSALAAAGVRRRVTGLMCIAENMIGANATRPGDVIRPWGGARSVEVLNTDAEGRLVLADGLAYAVGELGATVLVDIATLTGAVSVALGKRTAGLFASDDTLAAELAAAGERAGERMWRLPLVEDYHAALESPVADLANIGRYAKVQGGAIVAGLFLRDFTGGVPWAHLDIAGVGRSDSDDGELSRGGTGWGVRMLLTWLAG